jgi:hypothetical protein
MDSKLTTAELKELGRYEKTISEHLGSFITVGTALEAIRDNKLYRQHYPNFTQYCKDRWGITTSYASRLIKAATVGQEMGVENEAQARELSKVKDPEMRKQVLNYAKEQNMEGPMTGTKIHKASLALGAIDAKEVESHEWAVDGVGTKITINELNPVFEARQSLEKVICDLNDIRKRLSSVGMYVNLTNSA